MTFILGLTGSIGMGKSTVAAQFQRLGARVVDADALVHQLMAPRGAAYAPIAAAFQQAVENGRINRQVLGRIVFAEDARLKQLEHILHPLVRGQIKKEIRRAEYLRHKLLLLEIPLLYETGAEALCDAVAVTTAPAFIQRRRVMQRPGMTETKFRHILQHQLPDAEKRKRADAVIHTGLGRAASMRAVSTILTAIRKS